LGGALPAALSSALLEALDAVSGEGRHAVFIDAIDPQATLFGFHVDLELPQPFLILAKLLGDVFECEEVGDGSQAQAA
jgi:hypothetical protein